MILLPHLLLGAVIGAKIKSVPLAIALAFISHYFLDSIPHTEYSIKNIKEKNWSKARIDFIKVFLDFIAGIVLIYFFSNKDPLIFTCALVAIVPDGLSLLESSLLCSHKKFHEKIHYLKDKKISNFWRISSQAAVIIICLILLNNSLSSFF